MLDQPGYDSTVDSNSPPVVVLHLEDDDATANLFKIALLELNPHAQLHRAKNVDQAMAFLSRDGEFASAPRPDVVVLDVTLFGHTGFEVLSAIRNSPALNLLPVVMFSSSDDVKDHSRANDLGVDGYLLKEPTLSSFTSAAESVLRAAL